MQAWQFTMVCSTKIDNFHENNDFYSSKKVIDESVVMNHQKVRREYNIRQREQKFINASHKYISIMIKKI
jgi:hypothetical protein